MQRVGLIGLGFVGKRFFESLAAEYGIVAHDVDPSQVAFAEERDARIADSPAAVAGAADAVVIAVPGASEVEEVVLGEKGIRAGGEEGLLVVDASTTGPGTAERVERACAERGIDFLSAPFTRSGPREGIHVMAGGDPEVYERARPILDRISVAHRRIGSVADAQTFKLMVQLRYAGREAIDAEVVAFGRDLGVDPEPLNEFLGMDVTERYFEGEFEQEIEGLGGLAIWHKDVGYALDLARENDTATPLSSVVGEIYKATVRAADPDEGHAAAILSYWQRLNGTDSR